MSELIENKSPEQRKALGRGLAALLGNQGNLANTSNTPAEANVSPSPEPKKAPYMSVELVEIEKISANPDQPRKHFNQAKLEELAASIKEHGVVQPILVKKMGVDSFQIIAGERRWRASQLAAVKNVPVIVQSEEHAKSDQAETKNDLISLIENIQREDLSSIELAKAYDRLLSGSAMTQEALAERLGVSRVSVANTLRLLKLPETIKEMIANKTLSEGHSRVLLGLASEGQMVEMAQKIIAERLSVRDLEVRVRGIISQRAPSDGSVTIQSTSGAPVKDQETAALEDELRRVFGTKVTVRGNLGRGAIEIYFSGKDSLHRILHQMRGMVSKS